ncbi:MAG: hypothetical protein V4451_16215 [Pseudomonadota bacterium]
MGEIADMMIGGDLCECCGVYMGDEGQGFARRCHSCRTDANMPAPGKKVMCPTCGKYVKYDGLGNHYKDAHGVVLTRFGKIPCTVCGKNVKLAGLADHIKDVHGDAPTTAKPKLPEVV